jgi:hypothetical protein
VRTTLDIDDDVLQAVKELAHREGGTAGKVISTLARRGLTTPVVISIKTSGLRNGVPVLPSRGEIITLEHIQQLADEEGV